MFDDACALRYRDVHGYRRAYRMAGNGPPLLLIHGIGDSSRTWLEVLPRLAKRFTVIAPDLLGHGESAKPRADYAAAAYACGMRDLLSVLAVDEVTVLGHSLGGGVAMQFAYQFPQLCQRLVLIGTGGVDRDVHPVLRLVSAPGAELLLSVLTWSPTRLLTSWMTPLIRAAGGLGLGADLHYVLERYHALADEETRRVFLRTLRSVVDFRGQVVTMMDRSYLTAGVPVLLVWGDQDRVVPVRHGYTARRLMPGCRLEVFKGAGHFPHQADPDRFVSLIEEFHAGTEPARYEQQRWRALLEAGPRQVPSTSDSSQSRISGS